jgi:hypothetical protein
MHLNLPILDQLSSCQNILIAGMGGGFDVFAGLPIYFELHRRGQRAHLASFSFSDIAGLTEGMRLTDTLVGVSSAYKGFAVYFPEMYLARWFHGRHGEDVTIWCFEKTGVRPLLANYRTLVEHLGIDGILLIDGGVDSLIRGDEDEVGTAIEDAISLAAVSALDGVPVRLLGCLGLGAELDISHAHVFENIAGLTQVGAFLGSCALAPQMEAYQAYEDAVLYVQGQPLQDPSVISSSVISAVRGCYGDYHLTERTKGSRLWISPLMAIYWFFDTRAVVERNLFLPALQGTETFREAMRAFFRDRQARATRAPARVPLP